MSAIIVLGLGILLSACGSGSAVTGSACDQAVAQAIAIDPRSDTVQSVDGAVAGCQSLRAWVTAAQQYPDSFGGQDPTQLARERCAASAALAATPVCVELNGQ